MELITKQEMMGREWRTFERYPNQDADVVLHIKGYVVRKNKNIHDFIRIPKFNAWTFNPRVYASDNEGVTWSFSWLPTSLLIASV